jgi:hypothetical protein
MHVAAGQGSICGIRAGGAVACWTTGSPETTTTVPTGAFSALAHGWLFACAARTPGGAVTCWGNNGNGQASPPQGAFTALALGLFHGCGIHADSTMACWGTGAAATAPSGTFTQVSARDNASCAVRSDGSATCWGTSMGSPNGVPPVPPAGPWSAIATGTSSFCGLRADDMTVHCWGSFVR